jgi:hypothetical protein
MDDEVSIALSSKFSDPDYNYWYFLDDNYGLGIRRPSDGVAGSGRTGR